MDKEVYAIDHETLMVAKRAIVLVLKHEWSGWEDWVGDGGYSCCPECRGGNVADEHQDAIDDRALHPERFGHQPGCEWNAVLTFLGDAVLTFIGLPDQAGARKSPRRKRLKE